MRIKVSIETLIAEAKKAAKAVEAEYAKEVKAYPAKVTKARAEAKEQAKKDLDRSIANAKARYAEAMAAFDRQQKEGDDYRGYRGYQVMRPNKDTRWDDLIALLEASSQTDVSLTQDEFFSITKYGLAPTRMR